MATALDDSGTTLLKVPPHSIEAERSVLGGLMLNENAWERVSERIAAEDFYLSDHRIIYKCMMGLADNNKPLDIITVSESLESLGELENVGGLALISDLVDSTPTADNILNYAEIVRERATMRSLITVAQDIAESGFNPQGRDSATLLDQAESQVFAIGDSRPGGAGPERINPILSRTLDRINLLSKAGDSLTGVSTGFQDIDKMTSGLQESDLIIVAGRPSMGKTAFMMNMVEAAVMLEDAPMPALVFSLEMSGESLAMRLLSSLSRVDQSKIRTGQVEGHWESIASTLQLLRDRPLFIDDTPALTPNEIRSRARRVAREHGKLGLIVIDYLQLMEVSESVDNRVNEISKISRALKAIAKEFDCPLVAGSQLNRSLEQRSNRRPTMSDLRESGAIEQDADVIMAIYRDEVYDETAEKGAAEVIILKQRNGPIGTVGLRFYGQYTKFAGLEDTTDRYDDF